MIKNNTYFDNITNDELGIFFAFCETVIRLESKGILTFTKDYDRDTELADLFRESYIYYLAQMACYSDFIEDWLIEKQDSETKHPFAITCRKCGCNDIEVFANEHQDLCIKCRGCGYELNCGNYYTQK